MTCRVAKSGDITVILCGRRETKHACSVPGCTRRSVAQCDFELTGGKTCDAHLCSSHRVASGKLPDGDQRDLCPPHTKARPQGRLPGVG